MGSGSFVAEPDGGVGPPLCDFLSPDCEPGLKCVGYDIDEDGTPDETRCVPVAPAAGAEGDPCTLDPSTGADDCGEGLSCFDSLDGNGRCVANCFEVDAAPACADPERRCLDAGGPVKLCLAACDPRSAVCPDPDDACYPSTDWLLCLPDVSGDNGVAGDSCTFFNGCNPGLACLSAAEVGDCSDAMCCAPFCTLGDDGPCAAPATCTPWFEDGAPTLLSDLGVCRVTSR
jgi:hypothetical protein